MQWNKIKYLIPLIPTYGLVSIIIVIVLYPLLAMDIETICIISIILSYSFAIATVPLYELLVYSEYIRLSLQKNILYKIILLLLFIILWAILTITILWLIFSYEQLLMLIPLSPVLLLLSIIGFVIMGGYFIKKISSSIAKEEDKEEAEEVPEIKTPATCIERIGIKTKQQINVILVADIIYMEARGDYVKIYTQKDGYLKEQTIKYFEDNLPPYQFVRVHRSYIVNVEYISRIELYDKQNHQLILKNGNVIKTSIAGYRLLKQILQL